MGMLRRIKNRERRIAKAKNIKLYNTPKENSLRSRLKKAQAAEVRARKEALELAEAKEAASQESNDSVEILVDSDAHIATGFGTEPLIIESIPEEENNSKDSGETVDNNNKGDDSDEQTVTENEGSDVEASGPTSENTD